MVGDPEETEDPSGAIAAAIDHLYSVFHPYGLRPHVEGCPCCTTDGDQARIHARSLRTLTADDLDHYVWSAMTTWGDADDFRHFLPRVLELAVSDDSHSFVDTEIILGKLAYANWETWPVGERAAVESFLSLRWNVGLTQDPPDAWTHSDSVFDADSWLCGIAQAGLDPTPYVDAWRRRGAASTVGHVAEYLRSNPQLLADGTLGNAFWEPGTPQASACAEQMRTWLSACLDDPDFQAQLAAWYEQ